MHDIAFRAAAPQNVCPNTVNNNRNKYMGNENKSVRSLKTHTKSLRKKLLHLNVSGRSEFKILNMVATGEKGGVYK